ncbi:MAG: hypothetical protein NZ992_06850 [Candidatus Korarchaeum sp.]|nr:hypothetical protein [Candidatus Korarchaeum sp.]MDW8035903.1 hypothetical protein [Candidatus Korarchaeum sp.]
MSYSDPRVTFKLGAMIQSIEDRAVYSKPKVGELIRELERLNEVLEEGDRELIRSWLEYLKGNYSSLDELDPDDRKALVKDLGSVREAVFRKIK